MNPFAAGLLDLVGQPADRILQLQDQKAQGQQENARMQGLLSVFQAQQGGGMVPAQGATAGQEMPAINPFAGEANSAMLDPQLLMQLAPMLVGMPPVIG